ncbi:multifunctional oxoglutarate decarboxylase/oxoglutarate dehydrogenase thiamine pyrophosphate-binding subunit/dihydrolipoyllysine-residue succinyltransferase subunit [Amycolatopsis rhabdoformis]|uniref:Multifunctional oxoglutarate decarboxylase/oxoglutarate dehydrogenase thiamine pyrophosphate-binding subunit/dihydrolipoyllysine-residue succinyltransferase subunit n=1 Tax=Amycolatopsis rhabdoformis TaxID=1448059 RepID=A0ABZ1IGU4_9PSEU|nr:multifunctional oxoglutarate decarboxylase/oxoglutarate dehydrogenase thiamine pyrophosphate-binding subunit/dihydrolipoyllysine-residue succinyltransferase subunit [Amycolatopsis rhabdoformis]WSE33690.1 multifunctional oxoglutarate decarboxylase/oxoglutarate dehydrogenase thiamine pyrophosphate-binding subunit/dihydrolipoyllysine-residue succinyltransferase subunit [Amycolatopsis rhabdoformis]
MAGTDIDAEAPAAFGANEWMVEELYERYVRDRDSVDRAWWPVFENYRPGATGAPPAPKPASAPVSSPRPQTVARPQAQQAPSAQPTQPVPQAQPVQQVQQTQPVQQAQPLNPKPQQQQQPMPRPEQQPPPEDTVTVLRGPAKTLASTMDASLAVPTATSVRSVPAKLMADNRIVINNHLRRTRGGKVSYTHLLGWALVQAVKQFPSQNVHYDVVDGKPVTVAPAHLGLGIAIDLPRPDRQRALLVPVIKDADTLTFGEFLARYEDLVSRARSNALTVTDFAGATMTLTNPGGIGTEHSVPRLTRGQGSIIGAGALEYPAAFQGASDAWLAENGVGKTMTLTSTYDHRVIQGAGSGEFLRLVHGLLLGEHGFYEDIFTALRIPYEPIRWAADVSVAEGLAPSKETRVHELVTAFRERGHLMADTDPLGYRQRSHPDLELAGHGLTLWDLDREFVTGDLGGERRRMPLRDILGVLRDAYCRTTGIEYTHLQDPAQRRWFQERVERPYVKPTHTEQTRVLGKLTEAEAFETFLQTKYVGQTRFSLEGGESAIALLDAILSRAAEEGLAGATIAMAHRGRLNVLANIAGKTYRQIFDEFEDTRDEETSDGSGDVKYHLGTEGVFAGPHGSELPVYLAANPSHLDAVDGVLLGVARARQDRAGDGRFSTLPIIVHGDAALAGEGVVGETMQMSQLRGYRVGGTIRININNQVGFTTAPQDGRTSVYSTDVAKTIQAPILHVNGDDPEAVVRAGQLAFAYRQEFGRDVVIDLICYRRRGHNEADDPSMTQPQMYALIGTKPSVRELYTEALVGRGDITAEEYEQAHRDFQHTLERSFKETGASGGAGTFAGGRRGEPARAARPTATSDVVLKKVGTAFGDVPAGFTVHPKLAPLLAKRAEMAGQGGIDWAFAELLAFGSLVVDGVPVRLAGQDSRRGTFVQRHAVLHDQRTGREWTPLAHLEDGQASFEVYDSLLSEYAALGFEYGYSVERPEALVLWEAQFGDFVNGAQVIVDEFISSAEQKWGQSASLALLLPHGYEGRGPDHSSARIERFLQLCAEDNLIVAQPSTPASYFHLLRRQAFEPRRRPLVVFTPKSMLRLKAATSSVADFTDGTFAPVLDEHRPLDRERVSRVVLVAGKLYYDLLAQLEKSGRTDVALVRLEQFHPLPQEELTTVLATYPNADFVWAQEEPKNQGAWSYLRGELEPPAGRRLTVVSRPASASPATGSHHRHQKEQADLVRRVLGG